MDRSPFGMVRDPVLGGVKNLNNKAKEMAQKNCGRKEMSVGPEGLLRCQCVIGEKVLSDIPTEDALALMRTVKPSKVVERTIQALERAGKRINIEVVEECVTTGDKLILKGVWAVSDYETFVVWTPASSIPKWRSCLKSDYREEDSSALVPAFA